MSASCVVMICVALFFRSRSTETVRCNICMGIFLTLIGGAAVAVSLSLFIYTIGVAAMACLIGLSCLLTAWCKFRMAKFAENRTTAAPVVSLISGNITVGILPHAAVPVSQSPNATSYGFQQRQQLTNRPYPTQFPNSQSTYPTQASPYSANSADASPQAGGTPPS